MLRHKYTQEEREWLKENALGVSFRELAQKFNDIFNADVNHKALEQQVHKLGVSNGLVGGQFQKGHVPFNKGMKKFWIGGEETQFKKGHTPFNHRPVGSERITRDGYVEIKVAEPNKWRLKHRCLWEKINGVIPKGHHLTFADGNKLNMNMDNLVLVSNRQSLTLHRQNLKYKNRETLECCLKVADIQNKITDLKK